MSGKFINTEQKVTFDVLSDNMKNLLNNPYYGYSDKKGSVTQYFNINDKKTTLDEATKANYSELGPNSPIRYNEIKNAILYGIPRMDINFDITDFGLEANDITGEAYVLPQTFIPYPGDFFTIDNIGKPYLFKVTNVEPNVLYTDQAMYKISYILAYPDLHDIENQVVGKYVYNEASIGTNSKVVIESDVYNIVSQIQDTLIKLKDYFYMIFYDQKVQTFIYLHKGIIHAYDPYLIEFIIRNNILNGSTNYVYVSQQMFLPSTFGVDYDRTVFSCIEDKDIKTKAKINYVGNLLVCQQKLSLLYAYPEDYYYMEYSHLNTNLHSISIFGDLEMIYYIRNNIKTSNPLWNIMIKYFNDEDITSDDLLEIKNIDYCDNIELYYGIPIAIFCMEQMVSEMLS